MCSEGAHEPPTVVKEHLCNHSTKCTSPFEFHCNSYIHCMFDLSNQE